MAQKLTDSDREVFARKTARFAISSAVKLAESKNGLRVVSLYGVDILRVVPESHPQIPAQFYSEQYARARAKVEAASSRAASHRSR